MVNDIEKLSRVIGSLEEQSEQIGEFNGVLSSVNEAKQAIEDSKKILREAAEEHRQVSANIENRYDGFLKNIGVIEKRLNDIEVKQEECFQAISELNILTPERFDRGRADSDKVVMEKIQHLQEALIKATESNDKKIGYLKSILLFGFALITAGIFYIALT